ncbi:MAG: hypothetical protein K8R85_00185 [Bacteroidetes bacterium]|nr:hypothetical protein [Bacteroidota bacterium]
MAKISTKKNIASLNPNMNTEVDNSKEFPYEPGNNVINNILNYSKVLSIRKSKSMAYFELVLN